MKQFTFRRSLHILILSLGLAFATVGSVAALGSPNPRQSGSTGMQGTISAPPPKNAPTISVPVSGRTFTAMPITVSGLCNSGLLVKIFSNNIFVGAAECSGSSYSLQVDLFGGQNDLIARQYDALDQASPDSNTVSVTFQGAQFTEIGQPVSLTSNYAELGADPGSLLSWPVILSGGTGPYAVTVDWGDGTSADPQSLSFAGGFNITHTYKNAGVYRVTVRASDSKGQAAYLQLVGVGNGTVTQAAGSKQPAGTVITKRIWIWWPLLLIPVFMGMSFWLGKRAELQTIHHEIERHSGQ